MFLGTGRLLWITICTGLFAIGTLVFVTNIKNSSANVTLVPAIIHDRIRRGEHYMYGTLQVPLSCDELNVAVRQDRAFRYILSFTTWSDPSVPCNRETTQREFKATVFAPSVGVRFVATLDDVEIPIAVFSTVDK